MGRSVMVRIDTAEKWCVKGTVLEILAENIILPQVSTSRTNVLPTRQHLENAERSTPNRRTRVSSSKPRELDSRLEAVEEHLAKDVSTVSLTPADLVMAGVLFIVLFFISMLAPVEAFLGLGAFVADKMTEKHTRRIAALSQGLRVVEPWRKAVWADLKGDFEWVKNEDGGNVGERILSALPSEQKVEDDFDSFEVSPSAPVILPLEVGEFEGENCESAVEHGQGTGKCDENVCCGGNGQDTCCGNGEAGGCD